MEMDVRSHAETVTKTPSVLIITLTVPRLLPRTGVQYIKGNNVTSVRKRRKKMIQAARMKPVDVATIKHSCASNTPQNA